MTPISPVRAHGKHTPTVAPRSVRFSRLPRFHMTRFHMFRASDAHLRQPSREHKARRPGLVRHMQHALGMRLAQPLHELFQCVKVAAKRAQLAQFPASRFGDGRGEIRRVNVQPDVENRR